MNVLFLTMNPFTDIEMHNIYADLMKVFIQNGHKPYIVTPREKKSGEGTALSDRGDHAILTVQIGNTSGVSFVEKGISTVTLDSRFYRAIKTHLADVSFDLILYSTPPITLCGTIAKLKREWGCRTYLMLKDIFPQNAVDLGLFPQGSVIDRYFRQKEKRLYRLSDRIGCMSPANVSYLLKHQPALDPKNVTVCANAITPKFSDRLSDEERQAVRQKYNIPLDKTVFMYGGNLGKPQDIPFVIRCLQENADKPDRFFVICGTGSEFPLLDEYVREKQPDNVLLLNGLPQSDYVDLVRALDVGLIFLDHRFTIPNFPSRVLSYMECSLPVLVCTDPCTDLGPIAEAGGFGWYCESDDPAKFTACVDAAVTADRQAMGARAREFLETEYSVSRVYEQILNV
ncbi:MAG: glycosyltransferase family 4 protein [Clostridia bacterium]|nr:glycosyltransferase family 4 protein [Clostridia bacterium]